MSNTGIYSRQKLITLLFACCSYLLSSAVYALDNKQKLQEWYNHYYQHQDTRLVVPALEFFYASSHSQSPLRVMSLQGFFSTLFKSHPDLATGWVTDSQLSIDERKPLLIALSMAGLKSQAIDIAKHDHRPGSEIRLLENPELTLENKIQSMTKDFEVGLLWGAFKASGDTKYLDKLINLLLKNIQSQTSNNNEDVLNTVTKSLQYQRLHDSVINTYFHKRFNELNEEQQTEIDLLFAGLDDNGSEIDCE